MTAACRLQSEDFYIRSLRQHAVRRGEAYIIDVEFSRRPEMYTHELGWRDSEPVMFARPETLRFAPRDRTRFVVGSIWMLTMLTADVIVTAPVYARSTLSKRALARAMGWAYGMAHWLALEALEPSCRGSPNCHRWRP